MKYDCGKTTEFIHEFKRMCKYHTKYEVATEICKNCSMSKFDCSDPQEMVDEYISIVQKWSDYNPDNRETNGERFIKILKNTFNEASDLTNEPTKIVVEFGRNTSEFTDGWLNLPYEENKGE